MLEHKDHFHGSDLEKIEEIYGINKDEIVSFSANVNPLGISPRLRDELASHIDAIASYPDRDYRDLRVAIGTYASAEPEHIIVGNGTTELISLFIEIIRPKKALIIGPTYSEYEREITLAGGRCRYYALSGERDFVLDIEDFRKTLEARSDELDLIVLCNPNNPTSGLISRSDMRAILDVCKKHSIYVLTDETYVEFTEDVAGATAVPLTAYYNNLIILRGTSKFFATPGLRLGYAITGNADLLSNVRQVKNPWMINSLAEIAGKLMFSDIDYIEKTRALIREERNRLFAAFETSGRYHPYKPAANFMLIKIEDDAVNSTALFEKAIREKLMLRDCSTFPFLNDRYIRVCFMKPADNGRLLDVLL